MTVRRLLNAFGILALVSLMLLILYVCVYLGLGIAQQLKSLQRDLQSLQVILQEMGEREVEINLRIEDIFPDAKETSIIVTAYAPLDPAAVEGMCYSGDPTVTASGEAPIPGETVAAALPFGTLLYIEGIGLRRVNDRGVGPGRVDVVTETRAQAFEIGRSRRRVIILSRRGA